ncbi:hypothetical protein [Nocardioides sp. 1609]|uniref:hypothetical protein n=1 Tax=Nocardioides sp. 1609 TaxID=2508327 RepID=UPI0010704287|nr:hypothetical protein [Nocardioides sp. 1609]
MSAPLSPRTEAILDTLQRLGPSDAATIANLLDLDPPDPRWTSLTTVDRTSTVRRYLGRLVDAGEVCRLEEGTYVAVRHTTAAPSTTPTRKTRDPAPPAFDPQTSTSHEAGHNPPADPQQPTPHAPDQHETKTTSPEPNSEEGQPTMTETTTPEATTLDETPAEARPAEPARTARALLDECPHAPWPAETYDRVDVVVRLHARRVELTRERDEALVAANAAEAAEAEAIVDGGDPAAHAADASRHRESVATRNRALSSLEVRLRAAALHVLDAQESELLERAHADRRAVKEHRDELRRRLEELAAFDGDHWTDVELAVPRFTQLGRAAQLERWAESSADLVAAVRAVLDDIPLGFPGERGAVRSGRLATLTGVDGVPPLVDVETLRGEDALGIDGAGPLLNELAAELAETPIR